MNPKDKIAAEVKRIRRNLKLTQKQFCELFNTKVPSDVALTQSTLCRYERGEISPPAYKMEVIRDLRSS